MYKLDLEKAEEAEINCQHPLNYRKSKKIKKKKKALLDVKSVLFKQKSHIFKN